MGRVEDEDDCDSGPGPNTGVVLTVNIDVNVDDDDVDITWLVEDGAVGGAEDIWVEVGLVFGCVVVIAATSVVGP